jgi:hypothetical protein
MAMSDPTKDPEFQKGRARLPCTRSRRRTKVPATSASVVGLGRKSPFKGPRTSRVSLPRPACGTPPSPRREAESDSTKTVEAFNQVYSCSTTCKHYDVHRERRGGYEGMESRNTYPVSARDKSWLDIGHTDHKVLAFSQLDQRSEQTAHNATGGCATVNSQGEML